MGIYELTNGETELMVSEHSVQEGRKLMKNRQEGTQINLVMILFCANLIG